MVVARQKKTKTAPMARADALFFHKKKTNKAMNKNRTNGLNHFFEKRGGRSLLGLILEATISRNAPRGQSLQHQYLFAKNDRTRKNAIIAATSKPNTGKNNPPMTISGKNQSIMYCDLKYCIIRTRKTYMFSACSRAKRERSGELSSS